MCQLRDRQGNVLDRLDPLTEDQATQLKEFLHTRKQELEQIPHRGLRPVAVEPTGWLCPNCGRAHSPDTATCPEAPRGRGLRDRVHTT